MTNKEEIQTLINNYATYADTRQTKAQFDLFTKDGSMSVYYPWNKGKAEKLIRQKKCQQPLKPSNNTKKLFISLDKSKLLLTVKSQGKQVPMFILLLIMSSQNKMGKNH